MDKPVCVSQYQAATAKAAQGFGFFNFGGNSVDNCNLCFVPSEILHGSEFYCIGCYPLSLFYGV